MRRPVQVAGGCRRKLERVFWMAGAGGVLVCLAAVAQMAAARRAAAAIGESSAGPPSAAAASAGRSGAPAVIGRVEIPAIGMSTALLAGDDSMSLTEGAGHVPGTAMPGGLGTAGIAGHRDTHFRLLRRAAPGMDVQLTDRTGTYHYRITSSEIVTPDQVDVLDIVAKPELVLITCYPFHYIGAAPKRFVVHAALVSAAPDERSDEARPARH